MGELTKSAKRRRNKKRKETEVTLEIHPMRVQVGARIQKKPLVLEVIEEADNGEITK